MVTILKKKSELRLALGLVLVLSSVLCIDKTNIQATAEIPDFAFEGDKIPIKVVLKDDIETDVVLEEYVFHHIMNQDIAPEPDTWPHEKQMSYMQDVIEGKSTPYKPSLKDEDIKKILEISPKTSYTLKPEKDGSYLLNWDATHGRIFFRMKAGGSYVGDLYTIRVHCKHIDMRSFEKLKETLEAMALPIEHKNLVMVETVSEGAHSIYMMGHSPRFMLGHHEHSTEDLDALFESIQKNIEEGDLEGTENLRVRILEKLIEKEELFYSLDVNRGDELLSIEIRDNINDFSFFEDPNTEVYLKVIEAEDETTALMEKLQGSESEHDHSHMNQPLDKEKMLEGALSLEKIGKGYQAKLSNEIQGKELKVIVIYGAEQRYYLTKKI